MIQNYIFRKFRYKKGNISKAIVFNAQQKKILPIYVEKDYWVTFALYTIFNNETGNQIVFKGGTALSKTNPAIERFSEDIDLAVLKEGNESGYQLKRKIKKWEKRSVKFFLKFRLTD